MIEIKPLALSLLLIRIVYLDKHEISPIPSPRAEHERSEIKEETIPIPN